MINLLLLNRSVSEIIQGDIRPWCCWYPSQLNSKRCPEIKKWRLNYHIFFLLCRHWSKTQKCLAETCYETLKASWHKKKQTQKSFSSARQAKLLWCLEMQRQNTWNKYTVPSFSSLWRGSSRNLQILDGGGMSSVLLSLWMLLFFPVLCGPGFQRESWRTWTARESFQSVALSMFNLTCPPCLNQYWTVSPFGNV